MGDVVKISDAPQKSAKRPRPRKYVWLDRIKADPRTASYEHVSPRFICDLAELLMTFKSFAHEGIYAGRDYLANRLRVSPRHASRGVAALADMQYLDVARRGRSTNLMRPWLDGRLLFGGGPSGPEGPVKVHPDWTRRSAPSGPDGPPNLLSLDSLAESTNPPQTPIDDDRRSCADADQSGDTASGLAIEGSQDSNSEREAIRTWFDANHYPGYADQLVEELHQKYPQFSRDDFWREALPPLMERVPLPIPTFEVFWACCTEPRGPVGPARAAWMKLSDLDREEIGKLVFGHHLVEASGVWVCTWLKSRGWEAPPPAPARMVVLDPYSDEWKRERARLIATGQSVTFMDSQAVAGKGWTTRQWPDDRKAGI
jgi:hypothetical protein